jgi:hypothetical protein
MQTTSTTKPWITPVVIHLINKRWQAFKDKNFVLYNHYKHKVKYEISKSKILWSRKMKASSKGVWSIVKDTCGKKELNIVNELLSHFPNSLHAAEHVSSLFSSFFHSHGSNIVSAAPTCGDEIICDHFFVNGMLQKLCTNKAMGSDHIPSVLLKASAVDICKPLSFIYNLSYNTVTFPSVWKMADVIPLPKTIPVTVNQLRPISLLPVVSKLYEKIILKKYYEFFINSYDATQFAYRKSSSTVCALLTVHDCIVKYLDDPNICAVRVLTFDMSRAFDSVPHKILIEGVTTRCEYFGRWLHGYLCHRQQRVRLGETLSSFSCVTSGVPQGSILGPYLFAVFMSTFSTVDSKTKLVKYADDVTLVLPVFKNNIDDFSTITNEINNFSMWCVKNCMTINNQKTKVLSVTLKPTPLLPVPNLNNVTSLKLLGIIFNNKLSWTTHFDYMLSKLSKRLYALRILKSFLSHDEMVMVFNATFRSIMDYACQVFMNPGKLLDKKLSRLCRRAFRIFHSDRMCNKCDMNNVVQRRSMLAMRLFKLVKDDRHHILHDLLPQTSERSDRFILPHVRTSRRIDGFFFSCAKFYNESL